MSTSQTLRKLGRKVSTVSERADVLRTKKFLSTGIHQIDILLGGGFPAGQISEIVGGVSGGKTSLLFMALAKAVEQRELIVYVDVFDSLDPHSAREAGICFDRLLWLRCNGSSADRRIAQAIKALDILARSDSFGVVVLDVEPTLLVSADRINSVQKLPFHIWFRLKQIIRGKKTVLLLTGRRPCSGSAAAVVIGANRKGVRWSSQSGDSPAHTDILRGIFTHITLLRGKKHGHVQVYCGL